MNEPEKEPDSGSAVMEAIRRKRDRRSAVGADLEALEASLLADIEAFDQRALSLDSRETGQKTRLSVPESAQPQFPEIVPDGVARRLPEERKPPAASTATAQAARMPPKEAPKMSLMEQLRQQASARQQDEDSRRQELTVLGRQLDGALRKIFSYCNELVQQLNILRPPVERHYSMLGAIEFSGLEWQKGFADYRTQQGSGGGIYEMVTLSCQLARPERLRIERDGLAAEKFRKILFDNGVVFTFEEVKNARSMVEKVVFSIDAEVKVNVRWHADLARGAIVLETRNLERFGSLSHAISPESVNSTMLDEFARLLLGQPNSFREYLRRS